MDRDKTSWNVAMMVRPEYRDLVFSESLISEIEQIAGRSVIWVDPEDGVLTQTMLRDVDVIFASWGTPIMDSAFLEAAPRLKAVFYAAGSPNAFLTPEFFDREITLSCAQSANAIPVVEFSTSVILLSLKRVWLSMRETHRDRSWIKPERTVAGAYQSTIGLISLGLIGRGVAAALSRHDLKVLAYDPFVSQEEALRYGAEMTSMEQIFSESDVVSIHSPLIPSTRGMIGESLLQRMKPRATLVNTARGGVIRQNELCDFLRQRTDVSAVLDVTEPEPPNIDSPIWDLPNVFLTPHSSGSLGRECQRMARFMIDEFRRYTRSTPILHRVTRQDWES